MEAKQDSVQNTLCFSPENFAKIKNIMYDFRVSKGSHLFWEGDTADKLYYIKDGKVRITKSNIEGKQFILYMFKTGDFLGQIDPYQDSKQSFNAEAVEDCVIGTVQKTDLEVLLWQHGDLAIEFVRWMGLTHRLTQTKFRDLMLYGKPGALCSTLIRLANTYGVEQGEHILIQERLTNTDLADHIGAARESVNRMLHELKEQDVLAIENGHILIKKMDYLKNVCNCELCPKEICRI
ncbi:Crp/Fnr family transcriptional regulator [Paenibacillus sediminis]|uniref:CRP/FNR family transcriptional regulator n=1 Tax=Paenibacillus sediminis TaxID=664909 RepID=A0ABS4H416_9BACL|nr:Crp/Fnr family transcriptional regulator [Paenibacillus sediminis]MBP1937246.1 CRP/FNR family transcriptional regulator [Paenibacillus sediminis]